MFVIFYKFIIWFMLMVLGIMGLIAPDPGHEGPIWAWDKDHVSWVTTTTLPPAPEYKKRPPTKKEEPQKNTAPIVPPTTGDCGNGLYDTVFDPCESQYNNTMQYLGLVQSHFGGQWNTAMCVMYGESRGTANVTNSIGARGLFQLMPNWADNAWAGSAGISYADLLQPAHNVFVAKLVYDIQGWNAWSAYRRGYVKDCINKRAFTAGYVFPGVPAPTTTTTTLPPTTTTTTVPETTTTTVPPSTTTTTVPPSTTTTTLPPSTTTTTIPPSTTTTTVPDTTTTTIAP